jgi:hypothetical protein
MQNKGGNENLVSQSAEKITYLPQYLYTTSGARFECLHVGEGKTYAEYYLCTPDELHLHDSSELLMVLWEDGGYVGYYHGIRFWNESFSVQGGGN